MRSLIVICAAVGLAACSPPVPDSGIGVGFTDYNTYLRQQAGLRSLPIDPQNIATAPPIAAPNTGFSPSAAAAAIAKAEGATAPLPFQFESASPSGAAPLTATPLSPVAVTAPQSELRGITPTGIQELTVNYDAATSGVSDEQDFDAVAARRSIEGDKQQIERNRAQYQIDQPSSVPQRSGNGGPSIVEYALATQHPLGVKLFRRSPLRFKNPQTACAGYETEDTAQEAFLSAGGPNRDPLGLDPDGDGFACGWDPRPFRALAQ
jgi:hypothetical protein